jgi:hypothetical protein
MGSSTQRRRVDARPMRSRKSRKPDGVRCSAVSEKSLFIQGILLTCISLQKQVRQSIVHVLDERAKVAPDTTGSVLGRSDWPSETDRICLLSTYAGDEWFRHRNQQPREWRISAGSGVCVGWVFCMGSLRGAASTPRSKRQMGLSCCLSPGATLGGR